MSEQSDSDIRVWRAVDAHRAHALHRLDAVVDASVGKTFGWPGGEVTSVFLRDLARMLAWDFSAVGLVVHDGTQDTTPGGVWLAPSPDTPGILVAWAQHEGSVMILGTEMHDDVQRQMRLGLYEMLHSLRYPVRTSGGGCAHIVTGFRPALTGYHPPG